MAEHDAIDFSWQQFFDHGRGRIIREMSMSGLDALFHRPGPMGIVLQELFVVVRLDDQGVHLPQPLHDHFRGVTEIGNETERARPSVKCETHGIDCVMRHRKSLHRDVAYPEFRAGAKNSPVSMLVQGATAANRFRGLRIGVDGDLQFPAKNFEPANVVAMFVGKEDTIELLRSDTALLEADRDLARTEPAIDQNPAMIGGDERAVSGTAAAEHCQTEHERYLETAFHFSQIKFTRRAKISPAGKARICFFLS